MAHFLILFKVYHKRMKMAYWRNDTDEGKRGTRRRACPSDSLFTTNPIL